MIKRYYTWVLAGTLLFASLFSCVDGDYHISDINRDGVFSQDKGLFIPLGNFDTIRFQTYEMNTAVEVIYIKTVEGLFSGDLYKNFVIPNKGKEEAIGDVSLSGDFLSNIANPEAKNFSDYVVSTQIIKKDGEDTGIQVADQKLQVATTSKQTFDLLIAKEDVLKLKEAYSIRIIFAFSSKQVEKGDYVLINNVKMKSSGGIRLNWD